MWLSYITKSDSLVALKPCLEKERGLRNPCAGLLFLCRRESIFLVAPSVAVARRKLILHDILPSLYPLRLRHRVHARRLPFLPAEGTAGTLPALVRLKEFREFCEASRNAIPAALNFSNGSRRTRVCSVFSEIFFLLATWTLTKLRPRVGAQPNFRLTETNDPGLVPAALRPYVRHPAARTTPPLPFPAPSLDFRPSAFSPSVG